MPEASDETMEPIQFCFTYLILQQALGVMISGHKYMSMSEEAQSFKKASRNVHVLLKALPLSFACSHECVKVHSYTL